MTALTVLIMVMGEIIGGPNGLWLAFGLAVIMNMGAYWFSGSYVLAKTKAQVVGPQQAPELYQLVEHLAQRAGLPTPKVAVVNDPAPNAFATGRNPSHAVVAVTTGLLNIVSREELAGVLGHELAHVKHRDILIGSIVAVLAGAIMILGQMGRFAALFTRSGSRQGSPLAGLVMAIVAPFAALVIQAAISRSREYLADDGGADIAGSSLGLASALEKLAKASERGVTLANPHPATASLFIINPLNFKGLSNLFATHPPIDERINRLRGLRP
ncbi:MAG: zinc metalloprotease HtpX [Deltaproteobacteria bacterium]|nr:zinc metalloprotease HtpX [Deltaproteobacteria bacterium]